MSTITELRAAALAYAARGWHVFPIWPGTKTAAVADWERRASIDADRIARCWAARPFNIGIAVGPSGLIVVDLDAAKSARSRSGGGAATSATSATAQVNPVADVRRVADTSATSLAPAAHGRDVFAALCAERGEPIPADTYTVATPNRGWQLYYRHPETGPELRNTKGGTGRALGDLIDTRGHGGYVVAAGSILAGRRYAVVRDADPMTLPQWLAALLRDLDAQAASPAPTGPVVVPLAAVDRRSAFLRSALTGEADRVRQAPAQRGNAVLWGAAAALGQLVSGGELDEALVTSVLEQAATEGGRRTLAEARATIRSGLRRGAQRPRKVA